MLEELRGIGLTDGESKAYLALLDIGSSSVGPIAKKTGISYSKIYEVLQRLTDKGLVSFIIKEKTKYFQAVEPRRLYEFLEIQESRIEENKDKLKRLIPKLEKLGKFHKKEEAQIFAGISGVRAAYEHLIKDAKKGDISLFFYVYDGRYAEYVDDFYIRTSSLFRRRGIRFFGISHREYRRSRLLKFSHLNIKMRFVSFPLPGTIDIFQDKILHIAWSDKPLGILIQSKEIAENLRRYFNEVWRIAKP